MNDVLITSRDNSLLKHARAVRDGKFREQIFIEGLRLSEEAANALNPRDISDVICTERFANSERGANLLNQLAQVGKLAVRVSESVFNAICDTRTPQGIVVLASRPNSSSTALLKSSDPIPLLVILDKINNPSNAGAIVRAAEAAYASGVILTEGATDIFSPKALRGAMGSSLRLPIWTEASLDDALGYCGKHGIRTVCTDVLAESTHTDIDWTAPSALLVGPEATGLGREEISRADVSIRIPMRAPVESLNVAMATGIILYEAARQRGRGREQEAGAGGRNTKR